MKTDLKSPLVQVSTRDPELDTSPIIDESEYVESAASPDLEIEPAACYFNSEPFTLGAYVQSGNEVLQCTWRGVSLRKGERQA